MIVVRPEPIDARSATSSSIGRRRLLVGEAVQRRGMREPESVRGGDVRLERVVVVAADRQEVEDAAAVVVEHDDRQLQPQPPRRQQATDVVRERDVADQQHHRPTRRRHPEGARDRPVDSVGAAVGQDGRAAAGAPAGTARDHGSASTRRQNRVTSGCSHSPESRARRRARTAARVELARSARASTASSASLQSREPGFVSAPAEHRPSARRSAPGRRRSSSETTAAGSCHASSGSIASWGTSSSDASHVRSGLDVGRSPTRTTSCRTHAVTKSGVAQQQVVGRDRGGAVAGGRERVGEQRIAQPRRRGRGLRADVARLVAPGDDHAARRESTRRPVVGDRQTRSAAAPRSGRIVPRDPRRPRRCGPTGRRRPAGQRIVGKRPVEHERLAQRQVQVHRSGATLRARSSRRDMRAGGSSAATPPTPPAVPPRRTT